MIFSVRSFFIPVRFHYEAAESKRFACFRHSAFRAVGNPAYLLCLSSQSNSAPGIRNGDRGALRVRFGPFRIRWVFEHRGYIEGRQFRDVQLSGPFRCWEHTHLFMPESPGVCILEDRVDYELPLGVLGNFLAGWFVRRKLKKLFAYRHSVTAEAMGSSRSKNPPKSD